MKRLIAITRLVTPGGGDRRRPQRCRAHGQDRPEAKLPPKPGSRLCPPRYGAAASGRSASSATPHRSAGRTRVAGTAATTWKWPASSRGGRSGRRAGSTSPVRRLRAVFRRSSPSASTSSSRRSPGPRSASDRLTSRCPTTEPSADSWFRNDTTVGTLASWMRGKKIASTSSSIYNRWITNCFKDTAFQVISSPSAGVLALKNQQVDAFMYDDAFLVGVAANVRPRG